MNNMAIQPITFTKESITRTPAGSLRVAQITTLFDGKVLNQEDTDIWSTGGTGTVTFLPNRVNMNVTAGQFVIRQGKRFAPYFSGKPQMIEQTFIGGGSQAGVIKRAGYFSSSGATPYNAYFDGFWLEVTEDNYYIKSANHGTITSSTPFEQWFNYELLSTYDFDNFSVILWSFLWLGGAALQLWVATPDRGFVLAHSVPYVNSSAGTICLSPNQPCRYEIVSTGGTGSFSPVCSQIATEGSISESGKPISVFNTSSVACNNVGTIYTLLGAKKRKDQRDISVKITSMGCVNSATNDSGILLIYVNPTLSSPLTYTNKSRIQTAIATGQTVTVGTGRLLYAIPVSSAGVSSPFDEDYLTWLSQSINDSFDEYIIAYMPTTNNQTISATLNLKEFF